MRTEHITVFHCQECGRLVYQQRGMMTPVCCGEPMVCAVTDLAREVPKTTADHPDSRESAAADTRTAIVELK